MGSGNSRDSDTEQEQQQQQQQQQQHRRRSPPPKRPRLETDDHPEIPRSHKETMSGETNSDTSLAASASTSSSAADLRTLEHDLTQVEHGLTQQRGLLFEETLANAQNAQQSGRAIFDSLGSALTNIRSRLQDMMSLDDDHRHHHNEDGGDGGEEATSSPLSSTSPPPRQRRPSEALTALSQRLSTAERAHSTRMPLGLLQHQERSEHDVASSSSSSPPVVPRSSMTLRPLSSGKSDGHDDGSNNSNHSDTGSDSSATEAKRRRRRASVLLASRRQAELQERQDMELHEGVASATNLTGLPTTIPEEDVATSNTNHHHDTEGRNREENKTTCTLDDSQEEIELLLPESTREQLDQAEEARMTNPNNHYAYHHLTGSLKVLSQSGKGSTTFADEDEQPLVESTALSSNKDETAIDVPVTANNTYPPLYSWGTLKYQSATCNSPAETYQIYGNANTEKNDDDDETITDLVPQPKMLPPDTRLGRSNIASMSVSSTHMAFATTTGRILICGSNRTGAVDPSQKTVPSIPRPMHLELLAMTRILKVACGADHTAAVTETKSVLTWGSNQYGQLGHRVHNHFTNFVRPAALAFGGRAADVACGDGFTLVLTTRMEVYLCGREEISGYDALEQQGDDSKPPLVRLPEQHSALRGLPLVQMAAGSKHAVVVTAHGTAYAWGSNESGECGRMFPKKLHVPVPIFVPKTSRTACDDGAVIASAALVNWDVWKSGEPLSLADDVHIVDAACGNEHTVLVTKSGRLLVCGSNAHGQLGVANDQDSTSFASVQTVSHPHIDRKFVLAEAGARHTLLLDDGGSMWETGGGKFVVQNVEMVDSHARIRRMAVGGSVNLAMAEPLQKMPPPTNIMTRIPSSGVDDLMEAIKLEHDQEEHKAAGATTSGTLPSTEELARRTEELFRSPSVINSLFMDPSEIDELYRKLIHGGHTTQVQQRIYTALEDGMKHSLHSLRDARLMYPESVRILLLLLQCPLFQKDIERESENEADNSVAFDVRGELLVLLCETILGLPFEGYRALMAWTTTLYGKDLFVPLLVKPLVVQLNKHLKRKQTYGIPMIAGVLRWLHNVSERSDEQLARREDFHCTGIAELSMETLFEDLARFRMASKTDRSVNFYLASNAFLMSPSVKRNLLQVENQLQMVQAAQSGGVSYNPQTREFMFKPYFVLAVDRKFILQQTLQNVASAAPNELRKSLKVVFKGEDGVDAGGVTKEFFQLLVQKLFDVNTGMWKTQNQHEYWFNSDCTWNDDGFYLVGVLVGLALYNSVLLDVHFPHVVYRKLLGMPLGLEDMVDDDVGNGLKAMLEYNGDDVEDVFCLNFEVAWTVLGQERKKELKPGGASIPVTSSNKEEYVMLYVKWLLADSVEPQYAEFERGFMQVMEGSSLDLLHPEELELLVVGTPELDFKALEKAAKYEGGFGMEDAVIKNLWKWVQSKPRTTQLHFLKFCTGSGKAPIGGLGELPFLVQRAGPDSQQLPTAHTCFNTLILPDYGDDYDKLDRLMGRAVLECEGFGLQ
jgi:alpha-tubulin suppressor-like RCC1 family protein